MNSYDLILSPSLEPRRIEFEGYIAKTWGQKSRFLLNEGVLFTI